MVNDQILDLYISIAFCKEKVAVKCLKPLKEIIEFEEKQIDKIPYNFVNKFELTRTIIQLRNGGGEPLLIYDEIKRNKKFTEFHSVIDDLFAKSFNKQELSEFLKYINNRKKLSKYQPHLDNLRQFLSDYDDNNFSSLNLTIDKIQQISDELLLEKFNQKKEESVESIKSIDLLNDDYEAILDQIEMSYSPKNHLSSGFPQLDKNINGGFEPGRLYVFGGASGDGKSVLLMNLMKNFMNRKNMDSNKLSIYCYFTMENLLDESLLRLYCSTTDKSALSVIKNIEAERPKFRSTLREIMINNNTLLLLQYFYPRTVTASDLSMTVDEIKTKYGDRGTIKAIGIDYLDLLKSQRVYNDLKRVELGETTMDLKVMAGQHSCPVITVTQLNRSGYDKTQAANVITVGESIQKVENSDFVGLIRAIKNDNEQTDDFPTTISNSDPNIGDLEIYIGKNRSGPKEIKFYLKTNFSRFRIWDPNIIPASNVFTIQPVEDNNTTSDFDVNI